MTTSDALKTIVDFTNYNQFDDDADALMNWEMAVLHIANKLGVHFDKETEQWVTDDEGHPV